MRPSFFRTIRKEREPPAMAPLEMPDRVAALVSAFLVEPVDPSCAAWFATCKAANSPYARRELARERDRRDASVGDALRVLESEFRHLMEPYRNWDWDCSWNQEEDDETRGYVCLLEDVLAEIGARCDGPLSEKLAVARWIECLLTNATMGYSPLRAPIHAAYLRFQGAL